MSSLLKLLLQCLLLSSVFSRNPLNPCDEAQIVQGSIFCPADKSISFDKNMCFKISPWLYRNFVEINCAARGLTKVPQNLKKNVEVLDLSSNMISRIKQEDFISYPNISLLFLDQDYVSRFTQAHNHLYIEPGALQHLIHLKLLFLNHNYLYEFPQELPPSVATLDIGMTFLGDVTAQLRALPNLKSLYGGGNCNRLVQPNVCPRSFTITQPLSPRLKGLGLGFNNWRRIPRHLLGNELIIFVFDANPVNRLRKDDFMNATRLEMLSMANMLSSSSSLIVENGVFDPLANLKNLILYSNGIQHLPIGVFQNNKNLEILDLSWNLLKQTVFEARFLFNLNNLRFINLAFNGNCQSPVSTEVLRLGKAFSSLFLIEILLIGDNFDPNGFVQKSVQFDKIDNQSFSNLSNLTHLSTIDISHCNVGHISSDAWSRLRHLKSIRASNNLLTFSNKSFSEAIIKTLQRKLLKDQITFPHPVIKDRKKDQLSDRKKSLCDESGSLEYSNNRITTLSENKFFLSSTTMLDLSNNQIREIRSDDLKHLTNLCWIDLSNNPLQTIDHFTFSSLSNLKAIFFINDHQLSNFDFSFLCHFSISARIQLFWKLEGNDLALVLDSWHERNKCEIRSLLALDASHNIMTETWFPNKMNILQIMPDLVLLDFSYSGLQNVFIDHGTLVLTNLEYLYMIHNHLVTIPSTALRSTTRLRVLRLDYNNIVELKGNLSFLVHLKEFTIAHNNIRFIQSGFFSLLKLEVLDLSHNFISRLDPSIFDKVMLHSLLYLDIRGNDLDCFCHDWEKFYRWFITDASYSTKLPGFFPRCTLEMDKYYGGCVACHSPLNLRGLSISRFGFNTSCDLQTDFKYTIAFTIFFILFMLCGTIGYSKWFKRLIFRKVNEYFRVQALKPGDVSSCSSTNKMTFVFFDHNNNELGDWVDNKLVPGMINGNPSIELLLAGRDVDAGAAPNENLLRLVTKSRKTIVIFSGNFCNTPICRFVLSALQELQCSAGRDQLILVEWHGEVAARVPELIQQTFNRNFYNFLRFDQTNNDEVMFFETLRTAFASGTILDD